MGEYIVAAGVLASAVGSAYSANAQKKAARSAASAADKAASTPVTVSAANDAGVVQSTEAESQKRVSGAAKRRLTVEDTAAGFSAAGLRRSLN